MKTKSHTMDTLSDRLDYALSMTGTRKSDLAKAIGVKPQIIQFLCNSKTKSSRFTFEIATALGLNTRWLATGEGTMFLADDPKHVFLSEYNRVPILTHEQLLSLSNTQPLNMDTIKEWAPIKTAKQNVFCTRMPDSSMEPNIPINSLVYFESVDEKYAPTKNDIVIAVIADFNAIVIRNISHDAEQILLEPNNAVLFNKTTLGDNIKILGSAIACYWSKEE